MKKILFYVNCQLAEISKPIGKRIKNVENIANLCYNLHIRYELLNENL